MPELSISLERWTRDFVPDTKRHSLLAIKRFEQFTDMDAEKFLVFAKTHDTIETLDLIKRVRDNFDGSVAVNFENHMRSFLRHNGVGILPSSKNTYAAKDWHRGYNRDELRKLLSYLAQKHHKLYAYMAIETGLRAQTILDIRYRHIQQDLEAGIVPVAVRLEPRFYSRSKSAGFTFLGQRSVNLLREMIQQSLVETEADSPLVGVTYPTIQFAINLARKKAGIDRKIQPNHGFRKYFENSLDKAGLDHDVKKVIEGHFSDTRSKHYSSREWDELRPSYVKAYSFIDPEHDEPDDATLDLKERVGELEKMVEESRERRTRIMARQVELERENIRLQGRTQDLEKMVSQEVQKEIRKLANKWAKPNARST